MSAEILPFDFEEQAVRVVMRDGDPWFVAADICRVLELSNPTEAIRPLDDDERAKYFLGRQGKSNIISESGLYALVVRSSKPEARRFRKWITSEVLPAIRRHGRYDLPGLPEATGIGDVAARDADLWLSMIREARLLGGTRVGRTMWARSPLPPLQLTAQGTGSIDKTEAQACLEHLTARFGDTLSEARLGSQEAIDKLTDLGARAKNDGLFLANPAHGAPERLFKDTQWRDGRYKPVLLSLPGVMNCVQVFSLGSVSTRGIILPYALFGGQTDA